MTYNEPTIQRIVTLSSIVNEARKEFDEMRQCPDLDPTFFTEDELWHYVRFIIRTHQNEWRVINDLNRTDYE